MSDSGGRIPYWLANSHELLYRTDDQRLMVAAYRVEQGAFIVEKPREWSPLTPADTGVISNLDVDPNGTLVLALMPATIEDRQSAEHVTMMLNFADEVRRRLKRESK